MTFEYPAPAQIPQLLKLWKDAFGEWNGFWELFLNTGFSPLRCRCVLENGQITAALTWLDCSCQGQKQAYLYAVVTHPAHRGKGLCRRLLADTHALLAERGYSSALLVPAEPELRSMYGKFGYQTCTFIEEFDAAAAEPAVPLRAVGPEEFAALRRSLLPADSVLQEGENLSFLAGQMQFYAGTDFLLAAYHDGDVLTAMELLGNKPAAPGILQTLGCKNGSFRCPGTQNSFAMICPLKEKAVFPRYFGFAFD